MALVSNGNAAAIGLLPGRATHVASVPLGQLAIDRSGPKFLSQKVQKHYRCVLTVVVGGDYIRLTNEGGSPLATKKFAFKPALSEIQESRVSDTRTAPEPKAKRATTLREVMSVL
ncbi:hypothetical protein EN958_01835 [Mesorhizobium sp. M7A.F.Ca.CA.002.15.1.1]|uniref:hypothetical protein n=1 Tax=Mesorhizobium sp. M7A.F.Ca.CA.002.15.1.1 TaxID=2496717 RepID=UPI000FCA2301|nr:hypothetical protein [Mesorhizobium sp. M7A.F.Ca.CA.002.15.1.1]RUZ15600.1 hypothetical protein EN958_01835 [Mesorhizobium sp. M7A.F.Ca.CA.002.15.1.1]